MIYKEAYDRLKTEIQFALTEYEEEMNKYSDEKNELYKAGRYLDCARKFYKEIVRLINLTEQWEVE